MIQFKHLLHRLLGTLEHTFSNRFDPPQRIRRPIAVQLEFRWHAKR